MQARPYQTELKDAIRAAIGRGKKAILVCLPTGGGKTFVGTDLMKGCEAKRNHSLFLAPRRELVHQAAKRLIGFGVVPGIIMAGEPLNYHRLSQVGSFDTLHARAVRRSTVALPPSKIVIADEAHLTLAKTRREILAEYGGAIIIGLTATPANTRGKPLGDVYDELIVGWSTRKMMDEGYLVEAEYYAPSEPDLEKIKTKDGDYLTSALDKVMDKKELIGDIVDNWMKVARSRRTVVFCVTRKHARHTTEQFVKRGIAAEYVDGDTPNEERKKIFERVESGETQVLVNVFVASYGLDIPPLDCAVIARPTKSLVLYLQMGGRVLRPIYADGYDLDTAEGRLWAIAASTKKNAMIVDHSGCVRRHGFLDDYIPWTLDGDENISDVKDRVAQDKKEPKEILCPKCSAVFKGTRFCPRCGFEMIAPGEPVPTHQADLEKLEKVGNAANKKTSWEDKIEFMQQAVGYATRKGYAHGFATHMYREKFGVWPNDPRVSGVSGKPPGDMIKGFIKYRAIKRSKTVSHA